jgi:hypothetical protein
MRPAPIPNFVAMSKHAKVERPFGGSNKGQPLSVKSDGKSGKGKGGGFWGTLG